MLCCSAVCGLWSSWLSKGHLLLFLSQCCASHPMPTTCVCIQGWWLSVGGLSVPGPLLHLFIPQLCLFLRLWMCLEQGPISHLLSCPPIVCLLLTWPQWAVVDPDLHTQVHVNEHCPPKYTHTHTHKLTLTHTVKLHENPVLSVESAPVCLSVTRRRRKQDAGGSTVISHRALCLTIPGRSVYSLYAGGCHWTFTCANNHTAAGPRTE